MRRQDPLGHRPLFRPLAACLAVLAVCLLITACAEPEADPVRTEPPPDGVWMLTVELRGLQDPGQVESTFVPALGKVLGDAKLGEISGSGIRKGPDGKVTGGYLDADVTQLELALKYLVGHLRRLDAPKGSYIALLHPVGQSIPVWPN